MAKGDMGNNGTAAPAQPKIDQYSVMHKIMDALGGNQTAQNIAPSPDMQMPNPTMAGGAPSQPMQQSFQPTNQPTMGGRFGGGMGMPRSGDYNPGNPPPNVPMIGAGPTNPQDMIRRSMIGSRTFGG